MLEIKPIFNALCRSKAGALMLLVQIAITLAIVSNAAFIITDRLEYLNQETGYPEQDLFSFTIMTYGSDIDKLQQIQNDEQSLRELPGVINAAHMSEVPLSGSGSGGNFMDGPSEDDHKSVRASYTFGDENALESLGLNVSEGRNFTQEDVVIQYDQIEDGVPTVGIVSRTFAQKMFEDEPALGKTIYFGPFPLEIIGIVEKMKGPWLRDSASDQYIIMPMNSELNFQKMVVRTEPGQREAIMGQVEELILNNYNERVVTNLRGFDVAKQEYNASDTLMMRMLVVLVIILVLVTALGIFGLTVFNINKRTKQIGTRRALGAKKRDIVRYFVIENVLICTMGLILGAIGAIYLGQFLLQLYSLPALDNTYVFATAIFVLVVSLTSVFFPATKAASISPSVATRSV
ncbi:ABC transporter permease [Ningiella sp. W23]|uniref:ABC transporter permease n=1 Tax=Ningiella sp. W23 TaxID=3023715 RepID=UPI0037578327